MVHAVWDRATNSPAARVDKIQETVCHVGRSIEGNGQADIHTLALNVEDDHGEVRSVAHRRQLAGLA